MANPIITQTVQKSSGLFGKLFGFLFKYKLASIFVLYVLIQIIAGGISTGDWAGAVLEVGEQIINPFQDISDKITSLNSGVTGLVGSIWGYLGIYFSFYKLWLWFKLIMLPVNFFLKDSNPPVIRISLGLFVFYTINVLYAVLGLGESMMYPFILTGDIFWGLVQLVTNPQFSTKFDIFGEAVNTCVDSTCMV